MTEEELAILERIADQLQAIALLMLIKEYGRPLTDIERETIEGWVLP